MRRMLAYGGAFLVVIGAILLGIEIYSRAPHTSLPPIAANTDVGLEATGVVFLAFGLSAFIIGSFRHSTRKSQYYPPTAAAPSPKDEGESPEPLSPLDMRLLLGLRYGKNEKRLSKETAVDKDVISEKLDQLYERGYVTRKTQLTEKGYDAVNEYLSSQKAEVKASTSAPPSPEPRAPGRERHGTRVGELALGIIFVLISLLTLVAFGIEGSTPLLGGLVIQSYASVIIGMVFLLLIGLILVSHSQGS